MEKDFEKVVRVVKKLRKECPWDKKQTHKSLRRFVVEESYELVNAIDKKDKDKIVDELGDILLQVILHSAIGEEKGEFTLKDVLKNLEKKLKRRHPHIWGDVKVKNEKDVLKNWVEIKRNEKNHKSIMDNIPVYLPSLILAYKVQKKASSKRFEWEKVDDVYEKLYEEIKELKKAKNVNQREDEIGDIFFTLVHLANRLQIDSELSLRKSAIKFAERFKRMEKLVIKDKKNFESLSIDELDKYWNKAKKSLKTNKSVE
ncbi:MAG: nucleoside triphosphate pyrophosphohydrolase [bacterium]|nr:nucleoside triphosphate pyrophosphohydrolase [bacterium]